MVVLAPSGRRGRRELEEVRRDGRSVERARRVLPLHGGADDADARRRPGSLPATGRGLRLRPAGVADRGPDQPRAALPAEGPMGSRPPRQPGVGGRQRLRHHLPRAPLGAAPARLGRAAARAGRPADVPPPRPEPPAVGDVSGRGPGRRPDRGDHQDPPRDGRRSERGRHRPGDPGRHADAAGRAGPALDAGAAAGNAHLGVRRGGRADPSPDGGGGHRPDGRARRPDHRDQARRSRRWARRSRPDRRPPGARLPAERGDRRAAAVRRRAHRPRRLQADPQGARRHRQRRGAGDRHRGAAELADVPR